MKSLIEVVRLTVSHLQNSGIANAKREGEDLVSYALGLKRLDLYLQHDRPMTDAELLTVRNYLSRRAKGEPLAYVHGEVEFLGLSLEVNSSVLIPRVETEVWVSEISAYPNIWDICTGSGAIGLSLKKKYPQSTVYLSDISKEALTVARRNAQKNNLTVEVRQGDLFEPFAGMKADLIVINPPYISEEAYQSLDLEVRNFEPKLALVGGLSGLEFYERIAKQAHLFLNKEGELILEIGFDQGESVKALFDPSIWQEIQLKRDLSGHPRCLSLKL